MTIISTLHRKPMTHTQIMVPTKILISHIKQNTLITAADIEKEKHNNKTLLPSLPC